MNAEARRAFAALVDRARHAEILETARRYVQLKRATAVEYVGPCPACKRGDDRFSVNVKKGLWFCRHCGKGGGDALSLVGHVESLDLSERGGDGFRQAVEWLTGENTAPAPATASRPADKGDVATQRAKAAWLWGRRQAIVSSIAERYLRQARGLRGPFPATLGYLKAYKEHPPAPLAYRERSSPACSRSPRPSALFY
jgi:hypothetical protein